MKIINFKLLGILTVTFLLIIIPVVTAENVSSPSIAKAASIRPHPQLRFNQTQEKIIVSGELSPGKIIQASHRMKKILIPSGAIIHHAHNLTTVFDQNGNQLFSADDKQAETIHTFSGFSPGTFIHQIPNNSVIVDSGDTLHIVYNNAVILTVIDSNSNNSAL